MAKVQYSIKVDEATLKCIKKKAKKEFRSVNNAIELAIKQYCEEK